MFTTNISPFTTNNRWTTPKSSEISIKYKGQGIRRENGQEINVSASNGEATDIWYFDGNHSKLTQNKELPESMRIGDYENKSFIALNEKFNAEWM